MRFTGSLVLAAMLSTVAITAVADDRKPTPEERAKIEAALKAEGFTSWGEIELDDDKVWEVDDAKHGDGKEYDLELDAETLAITDKDPD